MMAGGRCVFLCSTRLTIVINALLCMQEMWGFAQASMQFEI